MRGLRDWPVALEKPMPVHSQSKHRPTKKDWREERGAFYILDNPGSGLGKEASAGPGDQVFMLGGFLASSAAEEGGRGMNLARRACPDKIKAREREGEGVGEVEFKWITGGRIDIHANYLKPGEMQTLASTAAAAEQIEGFGFLGHSII